MLDRAQLWAIRWQPLERRPLLDAAAREALCEVRQLDPRWRSADTLALGKWHAGTRRSRLPWQCEIGDRRTADDVRFAESR